MSCHARYLIVIFYPLVAHLGVIFEKPWLITLVLPLVYLAIANPFPSISKNNRRTGILNTLGFIILLFFTAASIIWQDMTLLYFPPLLIVLAILIPFASSLQRGHIPLITRFQQLIEKETAPEIISYTSKLTWMWTIFLVLMLLEIILLSVFASREVWSLFTNVINYVLLAAFFILEWVFRMLWFRTWFSPVKFIKQLLATDFRRL